MSGVLSSASAQRPVEMVSEMKHTPLQLETEFPHQIKVDQSLIVMQELCRCGFPVWTTRPGWGCQTSIVMLLPNLNLSLSPATHLLARPRETPCMTPL